MFGRCNNSLVQKFSNFSIYNRLLGVSKLTLRVHVTGILYRFSVKVNVTM